jgi:hypothetical protein
MIGWNNNINSPHGNYGLVNTGNYNSPNSPMNSLSLRLSFL